MQYNTQRSRCCSALCAHIHAFVYTHTRTHYTHTQIYVHTTHTYICTHYTHVHTTHTETYVHTTHTYICTHYTACTFHSQQRNHPPPPPPPPPFNVLSPTCSMAVYVPLPLYGRRSHWPSVGANTVQGQEHSVCAGVCRLCLCVVLCKCVCLGCVCV